MRLFFLKFYGVVILLFLARIGFAQDFKVQMEILDGEKAFRIQEYQKALKHVEQAEALSSAWNAELSYLKITSLDAITDYYLWEKNEFLVLEREVETYLTRYRSNSAAFNVIEVNEVKTINHNLNLARRIEREKKESEVLAGLDAGADENILLFIQNLEKGVKKGNSVAMCLLGELYQLGTKVDEDLEKAKKYYSAAAEIGNPDAKLALGKILAKENNIKSRGFELVNESANSGHVESIMALADHYYSLAKQDTKNSVALKLEQNTDFKKALGLYMKAQYKGNVRALGNIGTLYLEGYGVRKDYRQSLIWYLKGEKQDDQLSLTNLGVLYGKGWGVDLDPIKSMQYYLRAANLGGVKAMTNIAYNYKVGNGVEKDYWQASEWYLKAYKAGETRAYQELTSLYQEGGFGIEKGNYDELKRRLDN